MNPEPIPLIPMTYIERVRELVAKFEQELARDPESVHARACLAGWRAELKRLEEGKLYDNDESAF
jgi:hypothetical protein